MKTFRNSWSPLEIHWNRFFFLCGLPESKKYIMIMGVMDCFSGVIHLIPFNEPPSAEETTKAFIKKKKKKKKKNIKKKKKKKKKNIIQTTWFTWKIYTEWRKFTIYYWKLWFELMEKKKNLGFNQKLPLLIIMKQLDGENVVVVIHWTILKILFKYFFFFFFPWWLDWMTTSCKIFFYNNAINESTKT